MLGKYTSMYTAARVDSHCGALLDLCAGEREDWTARTRRNYNSLSQETKISTRMCLSIYADLSGPIDREFGIFSWAMVSLGGLRYSNRSKGAVVLTYKDDQRSQQ